MWKCSAVCLVRLKLKYKVELGWKRDIGFGKRQGGILKGNIVSKEETEKLKKKVRQMKEKKD